MEPIGLRYMFADICTKALPKEVSGGAPYNFHQSCSLFGLEKYGVNNDIKRLHGYSLIEWTFESEDIVESIWPRQLIRKQDDTLQLTPDPSYTLSSSGAATRKFKRHKPGTLETVTHQRTADKPSIGGESGHGITDLLLPAGKNASPERVARVPRMKTAVHASHFAIRAEQRDEVRKHLSEDRFAWLLADWGMGTPEFIATTILELQDQADDPDLSKTNSYRVQCDEAEDFESLFDILHQQLGVAIADFVSILSQIDSPYLVLDGVSPNISSIEGQELTRFCSFIENLLDYVPDLRLIVVSRGCASADYQPVELKPLDVPDTRLYLDSNANFDSQLLQVDIVEKIHQASDGLPVHLDRILSRIQVASLDAVLNEETNVALLATEDDQKKADKGILKAIEIVKLRDEESGRNSLLVLRILAVLRYGETIERLKNFWRGQNLYASDAEALQAQSLIESITLLSASPAVGKKTSILGVIAPKLLRVPKQVRDTVIATSTLAEIDEVIANGADFYFGNGWNRGTRIKLRRVPIEFSDYLHGEGNEFAILQFMISRAVEGRNQRRLNKGVKVALHYCSVLKDKGRNSDLWSAVTRLLHLMAECEITEDIAKLHKHAGRSARMTGRWEDSVEHFRVYFDHTSDNSASSTGLAKLEMAESLRKIDGDTEADELIEEVLATAKENSVEHLSAESDKAHEIEDTQERLAALKKIEKRARAKGWNNLAGDIAMDLHYSAEQSQRNISHLDRVLKSNTSGWNRHRAIAEKSVMPDVKLSQKDLIDLACAYNYSHNQRLSLLDGCHEGLWAYLVQQNDLQGLYRLFRHSSFV